MPRANKIPAPDPATVYVSWRAFATDVPTIGIVVPKGERLRGDDPIVAAHTYNFVPDGASDADVNAKRRALYPDVPHDPVDPHYTPPPPRLRDADAVIATRSIGGGLALGSLNQHGRTVWIAAGARVSKADPAVKANPAAFVAVLPDGVDRDDCLRCKQRISWNEGTTDERIVHAGQLGARDHPFVAAHPHMFEPPEPQR